MADRSDYGFFDLEAAKRRAAHERAAKNHHLQTAKASASHSEAPAPRQALELAWSTGEHRPTGLPHMCWQPGAMHIRIGEYMLQIAGEDVSLWCLSEQGWRRAAVGAEPQGRARPRRSAAARPVRLLRRLIAWFRAGPAGPRPTSGQATMLIPEMIAAHSDQAKAAWRQSPNGRWRHADWSSAAAPDAHSLNAEAK